MFGLFSRRRRSPAEGRYYSARERVAAAQARVAGDKLRGVETEDWIVELARTKLETRPPR